MARTTDLAHEQEPDINTINLSRLLDRLEHNLLSDAPSSLRKSTYERNKIGANLEHARTILLKLEQDAAAIKVPSRKQALQTDLQAKRALLKRLQNRLYELNQLDDHALDSDSDSEDLLARYAPAFADTASGLDTAGAHPDNRTAQHQIAAAAAVSLTSSLRARTNQPAAPDTATSSANAFQTQAAAKSALLGPRSATPSASDTLMAHHSSEQEDLTSSLLGLASALKTSTLAFADTLAASNPLVDAATGSLDKSAGGMEAAEKKMGTLRRMTEGKGMWGRWLLYAYIAGLWVAVLVIMFVLPKLRF